MLGKNHQVYLQYESSRIDESTWAFLDKLLSYSLPFMIILTLYPM